jgi:hypothetical protein
VPFVAGVTARPPASPHDREGTHHAQDHQLLTGSTTLDSGIIILSYRVQTA